LNLKGRVMHKPKLNAMQELSSCLAQKGSRITHGDGAVGDKDKRANVMVVRVVEAALGGLGGASIRVCTKLRPPVKDEPHSFLFPCKWQEAGHHVRLLEQKTGEG
jgi:hypothetical protein